MIGSRWLAPVLPSVLAVAMLPGAVAAGAAEGGEEDDLAKAIAADAEDASAGTNAPVSGQRLQNAMNPAMSFIADIGAAWFAGGGGMEQGGHAVDGSGVTLQGLELAAGASVDPYFRFDLYLQLVGMEIEEAAVTTLSLPWSLQARAGYLMIPFGRENTRHLHQWRFTGPSLAHSRFLSPEHFAGLAAEVSVLLPLPWYCSLTLDVVDPVARKGLAMRSATFGHVKIEQDEHTGGLSLVADDTVGSPDELVYSARLESSVDPNGAGKTTLIKTLLGLLKPLQGTVERRPDGVNFGYVPQRHTLDPEFPLAVLDVALMGRFDHVSLGRRLSKVYGRPVKVICSRGRVHGEVEGGDPPEECR